MIKVDLHTHSTASPDGGIKPAQYKTMLGGGKLDCIAITDHESIETAKSLHDTLGANIIVGEEISTTGGDLIGLFLTKLIPPGLTPLKAAKAIKDQGGLVYIPHPFESVRKGLSEASLQEIVYMVDIVEAYNGRAIFQNRGPQAATWARLNRKVVAASSDAHGYKGLGTTYTELTEMPTAKNLIKLLDTARFETKRPPATSLLYPKINRLRHKLGSK